MDTSTVIAFTNTGDLQLLEYPEKVVFVNPDDLPLGTVGVLDAQTIDDRFILLRNQVLQELMSRTGPEYVKNEDELRTDLDLKVSNGEISESTKEAFLDLYRFGQEIGNRVEIGGRKNANFQVKLDAHQGEYSGNPSVFTANVTHELKIGPARMPMNRDMMDDVPWKVADYKAYERAFCSLSGVRDSKAVDFQELVLNNELDEFKPMVKDFVEACHERNGDSS